MRCTTRIQSHNLLKTQVCFVTIFVFLLNQISSSYRHHQTDSLECDSTLPQRIALLSEDCLISTFLINCQGRIVAQTEKRDDSVDSIGKRIQWQRYWCSLRSEIKKICVASEAQINQRRKSIDPYVERIQETKYHQDVSRLQLSGIKNQHDFRSETNQEDSCL